MADELADRVCAALGCPHEPDRSLPKEVTGFCTSVENMPALIDAKPRCKEGFCGEHRTTLQEVNSQRRRDLLSLRAA
jgi:hypothetical protein